MYVVQASSPPPGCTIEQAKDYLGWDLEGGSKIKVTANQQECADYSASLPGSRFWTWSKTTKICYPKSSKAGRRVAGIHLISGNNKCSSSGKGIRGRCKNRKKNYHRLEMLCEMLVFSLFPTEVLKIINFQNIGI